MIKDFPDEKISTSNVVGLTKIADELDLEKLYIELENTLYEPEQFSGLIYRNEDPIGTVTLFKSGKILCSGAKSPKIVKKIISDLVNKLKFLDIPVFENYRVQIKNMVFTRTLNYPINLAKVALSFGLENVDYEPNDFPGLIYKTPDPKATFILFESGKIICTGADSNAHAELAFKKLEKKLKRYKIIK
jgi:transcription initiation factor TFIID TATA-box-binding protein